MTSTLRLQRRAWFLDATFGTMMLDGAVVYTVERPWLGNAPMISCIPMGQYLCRPRRYFRGDYDAIEICDVPGRSHILFHKANVASQLAGCIAPGVSMRCYGAEVGVGPSRPAFERLMSLYGGTEFDLEIVNYNSMG